MACLMLILLGMVIFAVEENRVEESRKLAEYFKKLDDLASKKIAENKRVFDERNEEDEESN